jgi:GMP reductase
MSKIISEKIYLDFKNVLIRPRQSSLSSRNQVDLTRTIFAGDFPHSTEYWSGVPIIAANMDTIGTLDVFDTLRHFNMITALHKFNTLDILKSYETSSDYKLSDFNNNFMISIGMRDDDLQRIKDIKAHYNFKMICIDVANGHMTEFIKFCAKVRALYPEKIIVAGNVANPDVVKVLIEEGKVDIVKVGIGPGSACLTRSKTGVGVPQLTNILECADMAHKCGGYLIADGGITCPGDMAKAFAAGADFVMCGGVFSGHDENPGDVITENDGKSYKLFYGMSSEHAMKTHFGKMNDYRSSEGRVIRVPYRGPLEHTVKDYLGGLRSTCTYVDAKNLSELFTKAEFIRVTQQLNNPYDN